MREIGYGDVTVNKNMKALVKTFFNILINCENYKNKSINLKKSFLARYLDISDVEKNAINALLIDYFDKYETFCFDLNPDSVLSGDLNFNYK